MELGERQLRIEKELRGVWGRRRVEEEFSLLKYTGNKFSSGKSTKYKNRTKRQKKNNKYLRCSDL